MNRHNGVARALSLLCALALCRVAWVHAQNATPPRGAEAAGIQSQWPQPPQAPRDAPDILLVMTDDVGFGASSTFGGPVPTPAFDAIAREGLRYNRFHTTAICSPTRAALLTGRNPHNVGMGNATNLAAGYPGYTSVIPKSAATIARILADAGYGTAMFGKAHITPEWEIGPTGPFDRWPTGLGFQHFYGFLNADTSMYEPALIEDTRFVGKPPGVADYHFEQDIADKTIAWIGLQKSVRPDRPVFVYLATAGAHAPHHAPPEWLARFHGQFDMGWDALRELTFARQKELGVIPPDAQLTPRPEALPAWDALSADEKRLSMRLMEAYAAALAFADHQAGRVAAALHAAGHNTLVVYIQGDNGSTAEGGRNGLLYEQSQVNGLPEHLPEQLAHIDEIGTRTTYNLYPAGWGWAMNTPFQYYKRVGSHLGGIRNGMALSWPGHVADPGSVRSQFHHVADVMPTLLEAAGVEAPRSIDGVAQQPLDGLSMLYTLQPGSKPRRTQQVFEMMESMALYDEGWMLSSTPVVVPWAPGTTPRVPLAERHWELYDLAADFSQARDLAGAEPARLRQIQQQFWKLATQQHILPIRGIYEGREGMPVPGAGRTEYRYHAGQTQITELAGAPPVAGRSFTLSAVVRVERADASGVIAAQGGRFGGYALYLRNGKPVFHYNALGSRQYRVASASALQPGAHTISVTFVLDQEKTLSPATARLAIDGTQVAEGRIETTLRRISHTDGLDIGRDLATPVSTDYEVDSSAFAGAINSVSFTLP